ncbi:hypothetical protein [Erythrobacter sp. Alg231-14]|uniref:hypothetical protein n=1 Tax=Erythrobacter sp. Alg231-14 TaxID=1922225 RepID=UPI000D55A945
MKLTLTRIAAITPIAFAAPLLAVSAFANEPQENTQGDAAAAEAPATAPATDAPATTQSSGAIEIPPVTPVAPAEPAAAQEAEEEERICRRIRLDMSSRRKSRVCLTEQGWRDLNNQR